VALVHVLLGLVALLGSCSRITMMANDSQETPELRKVHCNECRRETEHRLLKTVQGDSGETVELDELDEHECSIWWETTFDLLQCRCCRETVLRRIVYDAVKLILSPDLGWLSLTETL